ncbi:hypothetical protein M3C58_06640 [Brachybacterium muris]|uniref:hypothetical protein n=1 Tax=Brachybacterium muris TaxID=219301 RepID=UPI00223C2C4B|nr:hypothetical protein [Brachybacterium muris]MCT1997873.1 hypothetical protein [Brachybacterium muris]MCT2261528.1 hypothetical protein [Brachybacterium muris]
MAYRFNPPPNWPIEDPNWTPPPGWQPDPSWGPPPTDWNFWVADDTPAESVADTQSEVEETQAEDAQVEVEDAQAEKVEETPVADAEANPADHLEGQDPAGAADEADDPVAAPEERSAPEEPSAPALAPEEPMSSTEAPAPVGDAPVEGAPETAEYEGPDLEADLAQQAPYETGDQDFPQQPEPGPGIDQDDTVHEPSAGDAPLVAGGAAAAGAGTAAASGYGQASPSQNYGHPSPSQNYGSPDSASTWTATTAPEDAPKKGVVARFWWVGCLVLLLVGLLIAVLAGGLLLLNRDGEEPPTGGGTTTSASVDPTDPTDDPTTSPEPTTEEPTTDEPTDDAVTPSVLPTVDPAAAPVEVVSYEGRGTVQVSMEWLPAEQLPSEYGGTVEPAEHGEYLVVTAKISVTEGQMFFSNAQFNVVTPYGGELGTDLESYSLKDSGIGIEAPTDIKAGEEYSIRMLFAPKRAGGMHLEYDTFTDQYTWDIAE